SESVGLQRKKVDPTLCRYNEFIDVSPFVSVAFELKGELHMPVQELVPGPNPARDDVQQTTFGYDVVPRYICNNWQEIAAAQGPGAYPFDVVVIGSGMFGGYCAEKLYRLGASSAL